MLLAKRGGLTMEDVVIPKTISKHLRYWPTSTRSPQGSSLAHTETKPVHVPLVLMFPWLGSRTSAVNKYRSLYANHGMDVLTVHCSSGDFLRPKNAVSIAHELFDYLAHTESSERPLTVHAMSVGTFLYSVCLAEMCRYPNTQKTFKDNLKCQVFDSITFGSTRRMTRGVAFSIADNKILQYLVRWCLDGYFALTKNSVIAYYDEAMTAFKASPFKTPRLFFHGKNDPLCDTVLLEQLISEWRKDGVDVTYTSFDESQHAKHLLVYPEDYTASLDAFLKKCNLGIPAIKSNL